ncbi:hypothetical protein MSG28_011374 [Choristoneura fumiferana]|uniref:Uncharacterized protein n=1 Tax=Choristoneura fumiferana TaxID=7141 RepID=A0ACC0JN82_CHOFU|nr:hypothetical protein MSG28_011374 [Choristoneura fumiferana]
MPAILTKLREQASRVQPSIAVGVGVGVALAACALYGTRERKQPPCPNNNNNYKRWLPALARIERRPIFQAIDPQAIILEWNEFSGPHLNNMRQASAGFSGGWCHRYFIIVIISLQQSTAGHRPLPWCATTLSSASRIHPPPATLLSPKLRFPVRGLHSRTRLLHRSSVLRQCLAQLHFSELILRATSVAKNGQLHSVENGGSNGQTCGGHCGAEQCALCRGDVDTDNKQNIEDAEEPAPVEEHFPGLNLEFLRQMVSLAKIMIPGFRSHEVALLAGHTLCLFTRTLLSIYVAALEGSIMKHIVQKDLRRFAALLLQWFGIAIPATFINSMIRYLESRLALAFRTRLVNHAYDMYFKNQTYYRVANLDARIENADHRLTEDVSVFTQSVAHLYGSLTKPCFDLLLIVLTLASYSSKMKGNIFIEPNGRIHAPFAAFQRMAETPLQPSPGSKLQGFGDVQPGFKASECPALSGPTFSVVHRPGFATVVICMTGQVLRLLSPRFGALAGEEARMKANLRHVHASIIAHAEEVAFYGGHKVELNQLQTAYKALVAQMTSVFNKKLWYVMLEQFCMKYVWSGTGMVMLALPILTATADGSASQGISERTEYMTTSRHLLNSAADAIERLMSSYKEVVTLAGYAERVSDMLEVFSEVARGECVRAVHVTSGKDNPNAFQVTFRDNRPVPQGKITYTSDLSIHLRSVPIVTPACDVVANGVTLDIAPGTHLLIVGPNGCGKSSLFRIISGLWPVHGGSLAVPRPCACAACADERAPPTRCHSRPIMFYIPQRPYMSMGSLIDQVTYPSRVSPNDQEAFDRATRILKVVRLDACAARHGGLRAVRDWRATLSGGEKQRMAMARMFYHRPVYALLDECTSAVSMETEVVMYEEAVKEGITLLSITHRPSVWKYHSFVLEFDGAGNWSYRPLEKDAPAITPSLPSSVPAPSLPSDSDSN